MQLFYLPGHIELDYLILIALNERPSPSSSSSPPTSPRVCAPSQRSGTEIIYKSIRNTSPRRWIGLFDLIELDAWLMPDISITRLRGLIDAAVAMATDELTWLESVAGRFRRY